jgi:type I site-specific restriction-modification system R (restriction) subunit
MVILEDKKKNIGKLYVIMAPIIPITEGIKYIGDLIKKLIKYIPNIPENSTAGAAGIMNLLYLVGNNPKWDLMYDFLRQTLLKPGIEIINLMKITNEKKSISEIENVLKETHFAPLFKEVQMEEAIRQIKIVDSEEEIDLFAEEQRLNRLLKALYNLHIGNVLRASEILSIFEF